MANLPSPGFTAFGVLLVVASIPLALSLGPLLLGVALLVIGLRRLDRAVHPATGVQPG